MWIKSLPETKASERKPRSFCALLFQPVLQFGKGSAQMAIGVGGETSKRFTEQGNGALPSSKARDSNMSVPRRLGWWTGEAWGKTKPWTSRIQMVKWGTAAGLSSWNSISSNSWISSGVRHSRREKLIARQEKRDVWKKSGWAKIDHVQKRNLGLNPF